METLPVVLPGSRGWSMRHGHRHHLQEECSGRNSFAKSVARRPRDDKEEKRDSLEASPSKARDTNKRRSNKSWWRYQILELHRPMEGLAASAEGDEESQWWTDEHQDQASLRLPTFAVAPRSAAEEAEFLQMALRESEEEANLQQAIQESLRQSPATPKPVDLQPDPELADLQPNPEPADFQLARPERLGLLRQRSAPCIASEFTDAEIRMAYVQVPLTAWLSPYASSPRNAMRNGCATPTESRWEQAVERAAHAAKAYVVVARESCKPAKTTAKAIAPTAQAVGDQRLTYPTVPVCGRPPAPEEHLRVLQLAMPRTRNSYPACWDAVVRVVRKTDAHVCVSRSSEEYQAVTDYFHATVGLRGLEVQQLIRLQNPRVYDCYRSGLDPDTIMFHGCKSQANENSITANGFQVNRCTSGGEQFGTWFAYGAAYSNSGGFVFEDSSGIRHIFVCIVSSKHVVLDNGTMRVVGQGCAYPVWLLKFKHNASKVSIVRAPLPKANTTSAPRAFYVVRNGSWVLE